MNFPRRFSFKMSYSLSELCLLVAVTDASFRYGIFVVNHNEGDARRRYLGDMKIMGKVVYMCVNWIRLDSLDGISSMSKACLTV